MTASPPKLRTWLLLTHLAVLVVPLLFLLGSGVVHSELKRQAWVEVDRAAPVVVRLLQRELAATGDLGAAATSLMPLLRAEPDEPYPVDVWVLGPDGAPLGGTTTEPAPGPYDLDRARAGERAPALVPHPDQTGLRGELERIFLARGRVTNTVAVRRGADVVGFVVIARRSVNLHGWYVAYQPSLLALVLIVTGASAVLSFTLARQLGASLSEVAMVARRLAAGDLGATEALSRSPHSRVAELRALAADVATMAERLRSRVRYVDEVASHVAHEFRTPISTLTGAVELLADHPDLPENERDRLLARSAEQLRKLDDVIAGLLALARAERPTERGPVQLDPLLDVATAGRAERSGHAATVRADPSALTVVVDNLLQNAERHGLGPVRVVGVVDGATTGFDVVDAGPGIPDDVLPRLFERFFTTDRTHGLGLGLALVRTIVEAHGGRLEVDPTPGRTTFRVRLPIAPAA